jgi:hypothetical protein
MITDEELDELPDDPRIAFVEFEKILRARFHEAEQEASNYQYGNTESYQLEYINKVLAAAKQFGIEELAHWELPSVSERIYEIFKQFASDVDHITIQIRIQNATRRRTYSVGLDPNTKTKIHHYVQQIRGVIESAHDLPVKKRESLYDKLNTFAAEVDHTRTRFETASALWLEICDAIGQGFEKLEPARRWLDSIGALMGRAKGLEDSIRLPKPTERSRLEPPRRNLPPPSKPADFDDDIPF